jgi:GH141 insertion domain/Right handed beta helix region
MKPDAKRGRRSVVTSLLRAHRYLSLICTLFLVGCSTLGTANFYVAPNGDDNAAGTIGKPFGTIARAQRAVRALLLRQPEREEPIRVAIRGGFYELAEPIIFTPDDSGTDKAPVVYEALANETPVFSGGRRITGWLQPEAGVWTATIDAVRRGEWRFKELFVNGRRATRARHPNDRSLRVGTVGPDQRTSFTWASGDIPFGRVTGPMELVFFQDWSISRVRVKSLDPATRTLTTFHPVGPGAPHYAMDWYEPHPRYFLENDPAFLDSPGEWYLDEATGQLTYLARPGETPDTAEVIAPQLRALLIVRGTEDRPVRAIEFRGLAFEHCAWDPGQRYAAGQAGFHEESGTSEPSNMDLPIPAAVTFERAEACRFLSGRVAHVGGSGLWIGSRSRAIQVADTVVTDIAGNGVMVGEDTNRVYQGVPWWEIAPEQATTSIEVTNNVIEYVGRAYYGAVGVWVGMANYCAVSHNEVHHTPYTGVSVGWRWDPSPTPCHHATVEGNHIHHVMQALSDGGGIYTLGRQPGTTLRGNVIHAVPVNTGRAESNGMFLDEGSTEIVIEQNIIYDVARSPLRFHRALENTVRENMLVVGSGVQEIRYNGTLEQDIVKQNNTVIPADRWDPAQYQDKIDVAGPTRQGAKSPVPE